MNDSLLGKKDCGLKMLNDLLKDFQTMSVEEYEELFERAQKDIEEIQGKMQ